MKPKVTEETGLVMREETSAELAMTSAQATAQHEIQSAIVLAQRFKRNEDGAFQRLMKSASRASFAEDALYSFPRGGTTVSGPSVNMAREAARIWGNIRYGLEVVRDDDESRMIRGWAWDIESNVKTTAEDDFKKLIQRKDKVTGKPTWIVPDERDLRELTNRRGAVLVRNCILQLMPKDLIEEAVAKVKETLKAGAQADPDATRKRMIVAFGELNISPEMIEAKLGHPIGQCSPDEVAELKTIYVAIRDGNATWSDYANQAAKKEPEKGSLDLGNLKASAEPNRGHDDSVPLGTPATEPPPADASPVDPEKEKATLIEKIQAFPSELKKKAMSKLEMKRWDLKPLSLDDLVFLKETLDGFANKK